MNIALITLSDEGAAIMANLAREFKGRVDTFLHEKIAGTFQGRRFASIVALTKEIFGVYKGLVYIAPCGVVVRALANSLNHKTTDPAVVVVDAGARFAISLLSGHEGGANELALMVANILGAEPVITTTTEALKKLVVGVGCRRGTAASQIVEAVSFALRQVGCVPGEVRLLASAEIKSDEAGLHEAASTLGIPLRFVRSEEILAAHELFQSSNFVMSKVGLPAVAEPAALLAGRGAILIQPKIIRNGVTVAIAKESCLWSASALVDN